jgi:hypothetical protein
VDGFRFGISGLIGFLHLGHHVDRPVGRDVAVDDAVPQTVDRAGLEGLGIRIHQPVDGLIPDHVNGNVETRLVVELHHLAKNVGVQDGIAVVARVDLFGVFVPFVIKPARPRASAAVEVELDAARDQPVVSGRNVGLGERRDAWKSSVERVSMVLPVPEDEQPLTVSLSLPGYPGKPSRWQPLSRVFRRRHALFIELRPAPGFPSRSARAESR